MVLIDGQKCVPMSEVEALWKYVYVRKFIDRLMTIRSLFNDV